jgi:hypothetical protein
MDSAAQYDKMAKDDKTEIKSKRQGNISSNKGQIAGNSMIVYSESSYHPS